MKKMEGNKKRALKIRQIENGMKSKQKRKKYSTCIHPFLIYINLEVLFMFQNLFYFQ